VLGYLLILLLLLVAFVLACREWQAELRLGRIVTLRISAVSYQPKPKVTMLTNLRSSVSQFALLLLIPVDVNGAKVKLDADAVVAEVLSGEGARASVKVLDDEVTGERRFEVALIPGDAPGESRFKLRGDGEPGEGVAIIEEEFVYTATPNNAVGLGVTVNYLSKSSLPASAHRS
jgi:hypothetical protein